MFPIEVTFQDIPSSPALESDIRQKVEKLGKYYKRIMHCRATVDLPQKHKHQGKLYNLKLILSVPGKGIVVSKINEDIYLALRDAFHVMTRQLEELARIRRGDVKTHAEVMHGQIIKIFESEGYGFIQGYDGNEYYFSLTNVSHPEFKQLEVGDAVEYFPKGANDGRHAHHVVKGHVAA